MMGFTAFCWDYPKNSGYLVKLTQEIGILFKNTWYLAILAIVYMNFPKTWKIWGKNSQYFSQMATLFVDFS